MKYTVLSWTNAENRVQGISNVEKSDIDLKEAILMQI